MVRSNVPKFGNWDTEENVPYTTYFENPRRVSSSEKDGRRTEATRMKHERKVSLEDGELRRPFDSPSYNNGGNRASGDSTPQRPAVVSSDAPKRAARLNGTGFRSADHSPLHPHYQAKISSKASVVSSPSWERKGSSEGTHGLAPSTPGRSRLRSVPRGSETPDRGASVPKFGEWDETDPSSADGYSMIFNKVKEERHVSGGNASGTATDAQRSSGQKHYRSNNSKGKDFQVAAKGGTFCLFLSIFLAEMLLLSLGWKLMHIIYRNLENWRKYN